MTAPPDRRDDGFTLIEVVIAMLIMSIAVVTIVGALSTMITLTSEHRGHAAVEDAAHSFSQAVQAQAQFSTKLKTALTDPALKTLSVVDASLIPPGSSETSDGVDSFLSVDREVMHIDSVDRVNNTVTVDRHVTGTAPTGGYPAGAAVVTFTRCGRPGVLTPDPSTYQTTPGLETTISSVEYWDAVHAQWDSRADCINDYNTIPSACAVGGDVFPECGSGLMRVTLAIKSSVTTYPGYDKRLRGVDTTTQVLVRRGSG